jgi:hypothetical protein
MAKFASILEKNRDEGKIDGYFGASGGVSVEEVVKHSEVGTEEEGKEGVRRKAFTALLGWESKGHHMRFRETELFRENIGLIRVKNRGAEMFHVEFTAV